MNYKLKLIELIFVYFGIDFIAFKNKTLKSYIDSNG